jgi:hypothetical protein
VFGGLGCFYQQETKRVLLLLQARTATAVRTATAATTTTTKPDQYHS